MIRQIYDTEERQAVARTILEALPEWFGIPEAREDYISNASSQVTFGAFDQAEACAKSGGRTCGKEGGEKPVGFLCLKETGKDTVELAVMGVLKECHRTGIGTKLFSEAKAYAASRGYSFLQVKTVQMGRYPEYDATNAFYLSLGFREFEVFPTLWDEWNPCQVYVMGLIKGAPVSRLRLANPTAGDKVQVLEYKEEFLRSHDSMDGTGGLQDADTFEAWLAKLEKMKKAETMPEGYVPSDTFLAFNEKDDLVGMVSIRHYLNDSLLRVSGHIGYSVRKGERRKGYGAEMLRLALIKARELGISKALLTCDKENTASAKTILKNGGVLENEILCDGRMVQRYWITLL